MDDFGTGYSTMTMLKDQPVDEIKIDKGFIDDIDVQYINDKRVYGVMKLNDKIELSED